MSRPFLTLLLLVEVQHVQPVARGLVHRELQHRSHCLTGGRIQLLCVAGAGQCLNP
jgi:hypothetical protein